MSYYILLLVISILVVLTFYCYIRSVGRDLMVNETDETKNISDETTKDLTTVQQSILNKYVYDSYIGNKLSNIEQDLKKLISKLIDETNNETNNEIKDDNEEKEKDS